MVETPCALRVAFGTDPFPQVRRGIADSDLTALVGKQRPGANRDWTNPRFIANSLEEPPQSACGVRKTKTDHCLDVEEPAPPVYRSKTMHELSAI